MKKFFELNFLCVYLDGQDENSCIQHWSDIKFECEYKFIFLPTCLEVCIVVSVLLKCLNPILILKGSSTHVISLSARSLTNFSMIQTRKNYRRLRFILEISNLWPALRIPTVVRKLLYFILGMFRVPDSDTHIGTQYNWTTQSDPNPINPHVFKNV
jgi:hypothetical protein